LASPVLADDDSYRFAVVPAVICVVSAITSPYILTGDNLSVVARGLAFVALIAIGQASLIILGELDLSLGTIGGLAGAVLGMLMVQADYPPVIAIPLAVLLGAVLGATNGLLVMRLRLRSLILTIATRGFAAVRS
jgi:ribose transport system permease protein